MMDFAHASNWEYKKNVRFLCKITLKKATNHNNSIKKQKHLSYTFLYYLVLKHCETECDWTRTHAGNWKLKCIPQNSRVYYCHKLAAACNSVRLLLYAKFTFLWWQFASSNVNRYTSACIMIRVTVANHWKLGIYLEIFYIRSTYLRGQ